MRALAAAVALCCLLTGCCSAAGPSRHVGGPPAGSSSSSAWQLISSRGDLTAIAAVLRNLQLDSTLQQPFTGTLLLPNNEAVAAYMSLVKVPLHDTSVASVFLSKLISYHTLLRWAPSRLPNTTAMLTRYVDPVSNTRHSVTFIANGTAAAAAAPHKGSMSYNKQWRRGALLLRQVECLLDEQDNVVTIASADHAVLGGGVVHVLNGVLQASDLFPSLSAALASSSLLSSSTAVLQYVSEASAAGLDVLQLLETTPGTLLLPINTAYPEDISSLDPDMLLQVLQYHICPTTGNATGLISYPFAKRRPGNSCLTLLGAQQQQPRLMLTFKSLANPYPTSPSMLVEYPTSITLQLTARVTPAGGAIGQANIIIPNMATPLHAVHAVDALLIPRDF